jgi:para-nitrobenzyl esterase
MQNRESRNGALREARNWILWWCFAGAAGMLSFHSEVFGQLEATPASEDQKATEPVLLDSGSIRGLCVGDEQEVQVFKGIPYAKPPVGTLRWRPPQPPESWEGIRDCFEFGDACPQKSAAMMSAIPQMALNAETSEDCLYLNVWRPSQPTSQALPVMVWIHGGGYTIGAASQPLYDAQTLASKGSIVVSMNYRLGPFGFLAHPALSGESENGLSGNYGILDQVEALRWVQRNIAAFGGDPNRVMIFGESAGAGSVLCLMVSPQAEGLFHSAIAQSAPDMNLAWLRQSAPDRPSAEQQGIDWIEQMGLSATATAEELRSLDADALVDSFPSLQVGGKLQLDLRRPPLAVAPVVDGWVIPDLPNRLFAANKAHRVPLIIGNTRDEMTLFLTQAVLPKKQDEYEQVLGEYFGEFSDQVLQAYPATDSRSIRESIVGLLGDAVFGSQARHVARLHARNGVPTYRYIFSCGTRQFPLSMLGAHHACEIPFVFGKPSNPSASDERVVEVVQGFWINLARSGDPNGEGLPNWPATNSASDVLIDFENEIVIRESHRNLQLDTVDRFLERKVAEVELELTE